MADKLMYIPNDTQNYTFCRLEYVVEPFVTLLDKPTNKIKVPKVVKSTNKKTLL